MHVFPTYELTKAHMDFIYSVIGLIEHFDNNVLNEVCKTLILYNKEWFKNTYDIDIDNEISEL